MAGELTPVDVRLVPAAAGLWIGAVLATEAGPFAGLLLAAAGGLTAAVLLVRLRGPAARHRISWVGWGRITVLLACVITAIGGALVSAEVIARERAVAPLAGVTGTVEARVTGEPLELRGTPGRYGVSVDVHRVSGPGVRGAWTGRVPAFVLGQVEDLRPGERIAVEARLASADGRELLVLGSTSPETAAPMSALDAHVDRLRQGLRERTAAMAPYARGLIPGVAIGDDRALPAGLAEAMRTTSLTHLTAVSGGHVALVVGTVLLALARAPAILRAGCGLLVLAGMVLLVLPSASVVRAAAMGVVLLLALASRRPRLGLPALAGAVIALLLLDPWQATSYGFALSVFATAGLIVWTEPLAARLGRFLPLGFARLLALPIAAQCWCAPILVLLAPAVPTYAVPANLLAGVAIGPATLLSLLATVVGPFGPLAGLADVACRLAAWSVAWIAALAATFAALPASSLPWPGGAVGALALGVLVAAGGVWVHRRIAVAG